MIDVWHFYNGGVDPRDLADLPGAGVAAVQLNDGPLVHEDFLRYARAERCYPARASWTSPVWSGPCSRPDTPARTASR